MKNFILILLTVILFSCNQKVKEKQPIFTPKSDTIKTIAFYKYKNGFRTDFIFRILKDTFKYSDVDSIPPILFQ
jgi:hypothetical protein